MGIFDRLIEAINKEYDRRVKRSSEIIEYGMAHGHYHGSDHGHDDEHNYDHDHTIDHSHQTDTTPHADDNDNDNDNDDNSDTVISNVSINTQIAGSRYRPSRTQQHDSSDT